MSDPTQEPEICDSNNSLPARILWSARGLLVGYYVIAFYGILTMEGRAAAAVVYVAAALCLLVARQRLLAVAREDIERHRATLDVADDATSAGDTGKEGDISEGGDSSNDQDNSDTPSREHTGV